MPIPPLNEMGLLPVGVHEGSLAEMRDRFGQFQRTEQRVRLQARLEAFARDASGTGQVAALIVNGSFTTAKEEPDDIDLIVVLRAEADFGADMRPDQYNVLSARKVKGRYGFDVLYATESALAPLVDFFAQVRGQAEHKGMVRLVL